MTSFRVVEHKIPAQHIREYPNATANSQEEVLFLSVKQYIPLDNENPEPGDVTILGAHANAFPKEVYEAFWDDLLEQSQRHGWRIRSIWMADVAHQNQSGILNSQSLGNDPSWNDHARDLLHLINLKREEMPRPIIGIGHSMGGAQLTYLALMHPRLLSSLVLLDPTIQLNIESAEFKTSPAAAMAILSTFRRTLWPSREAAGAAFGKAPFYKIWDPRVFQKWMEYGLTDAPTVAHPDAQKPQVTLTTPTAQEVFTYIRPNYEGHGSQGRPMNRLTHPDVDFERGKSEPFYRPEAPYVFRRLPELRPGVLWIFGGNSFIATPEAQRDMVATTGVGVGGSGGVAEGRCKGLFFDGVGHLVPMEAPMRTAQATAAWIADESRRFRDEQEKWEREWKSKSLREKQEVDEKWKQMMGGPPKRAKM